MLNFPLLNQKHQNNYYVMDGRSRIATVRLGHAWGDTSPDLCYNLEDHLDLRRVFADRQLARENLRSGLASSRTLRREGDSVILAGRGRRGK